MTNNMESALTHQESLKIIREMIDNAKAGLKDNGFYYLLWGWLVLTGSLLHFILLGYETGGYAALPWIGVAILGISGTVYQVARRKKEIRVKSYFQALTFYLWMGITACAFILVGVSLIQVISFQVSYPLFMLLMGLGAFISGGVLRFFPLILGGILAWIIAIIAFFVAFKYQLLLLGLAVAVAYLMPGYALRRAR